MERSSPATFDRARKLLLGAVDTVIEIANKERQHPHEQAPPATAPVASSSTSSLTEHKRLFGFQPSKAYTKKAKGKGKGKQSKSASARSTWRRECICLNEKDQTWKPTPEDKMTLAKLGLGLKELVFDSDGDADHVHSTILAAYPVLENCGGYTLLRLGSGSKSLVEIEGPETGITVPYLKDILNQAKLYITPLQTDITEEDVTPFLESSAIAALNEPMESCRKCSVVLPLSQLRKHLLECKENENKDNNERKQEIPLKITHDDGLDDHFTNPPPPKRNRKAAFEDVHVYEVLGSPRAPIPESISPVLKHRNCGSSTYDSFVSLISDDSNSDWENDASMQQILLGEGSAPNLENPDLQLDSVLKEHRVKVLSSDPDQKFRITVRRGHIFEDTRKAMLRFDETKHLRVTFLGEAAIDDGGPRREFFMLLMGSISNNGSLFQGPPQRRILRHNTSAFQEELYLLVGKLFALSILNGGTGPTFLAPVVVDYLFGGISCVKPTVEAVPDEQIQSKLSKLTCAGSENEFRALLATEEYNFRFDCGVTKPHTSISFQEKDNVVSALCLHFTLFNSLAELEQLKRGLSFQKFNTLMEMYPNLLRSAFCPSSIKIDSDFIQDMFPPVFSEKGSNRRKKEEEIVMAWIHYLQSMEDTDVECRPKATLQDVMVFLTGCESVPPLGFIGSDPKVIFLDEGLLPTVSTCSLTLRIPIGFPSNGDSFKEMMDLAILGSHGFFGQV